MGVIVTCVGKKCGSFTTDKGEYKKYSKLHCVYDAEQVDDGINKVVGRQVNSFSVSEDLFESIPEEECQLDLTFNEKGKVIRVDLV